MLKLAPPVNKLEKWLMKTMVCCGLVHACHPPGPESEEHASNGAITRQQMPFSTMHTMKTGSVRLVLWQVAAAKTSAKKSIKPEKEGQFVENVSDSKVY